MNKQMHINIFMLIALLFAGLPAFAQVLPEDRFDLLYHSYDGDDVEITGPSILFRKKATQDISLYANYYIDKISSASIDVRSYASKYSERREEITVGGDILVDETILSAGFVDSDEDDFDAQTAYFGVKQEIFGGLTTINMGYSRGWDDVYEMAGGIAEYQGDVDRHAYRVGLSQIMTKNLIINFDYEARTDEGFLRNPYRKYRYELGGGFDWAKEKYPDTRTSSAFAVGGRYFIEDHKDSVVYGNARYYDDTWGINAFDITAGYTLSIVDQWLLDFSYRYYDQSKADFYSDLFASIDAQNFMSRNKELSTFSNHTIRGSVSYDLNASAYDLFSRGTINFDLSYIYFDYDDFRNVPAGGATGQEPLFDFGAVVGQVYLSFWF
ncbi:MAG: DUF3570 domain-containing protein [Gammaproteobacteria bacterium]|nr:DUF3570 domain-containing protein [Gammaproteobacteria bacterium]MCP4832750.1 DUF3570 domain-containing protein [Gammaproteobacteria bacterium]